MFLLFSYLFIFICDKFDVGIGFIKTVECILTGGIRSKLERTNQSGFEFGNFVSNEGKISPAYHPQMRNMVVYVGGQGRSCRVLGWIVEKRAACFAVISALSLPEILLWLGTHVKTMVCREEMKAVKRVYGFVERGVCGIAVGDGFAYGRIR